ncbi:unnamed protein product [Cunninghamella echinulata]
MTKLYILNIIPQSNDIYCQRRRGRSKRSGYSNEDRTKTVHFSTIVVVNHPSTICLVRNTKPGETRNNINKYCLRKNCRSIYKKRRELDPILKHKFLSFFSFLRFV